MSDGRVQLVHKSNEAANLEQAELGILFMADMFEQSKKQNYKISVQDTDDYKPMSVVLLNSEMREYQTGTAQFGYDTRRNPGVFGRLAMAEPFDACSSPYSVAVSNLSDKILIAKRGNCMFVDKARNVQVTGALGLIIIGLLFEFFLFHFIFAKLCLFFVVMFWLTKPRHRQTSKPCQKHTKFFSLFDLHQKKNLHTRFEYCTNLF